MRVDAFVAQMHASERARLAQAIERQNVAELERSAIARRIKQARNEAGLSQPEMAEALGVIDRTYQNYESVKKPRIPWGSMNEIAKITGKTTEWLIHGDGQQTPDPFVGQGGNIAAHLDRIEANQATILARIDQIALIASAAIEESANQAAARDEANPHLDEALEIARQLERQLGADTPPTVEAATSQRHAGRAQR